MAKQGKFSVAETGSIEASALGTPLGRYEANTHHTVRDSVRDLRAIANWESCPEGIASCIRILATNIQTAHEGGITARKMLADIEARTQESVR